MLANNNPADGAGRARHGGTFGQKAALRQARGPQEVNGFNKVSRALGQIARLTPPPTLFSGHPMRFVSRVLCLGLLLTAPVAGSAQETFFIPKDEGYGIGECFASGASCARTVADAWCAAMGRGPSVSFGLAEGAAIEQIATRAPRGYRVTCAN